MDSATQAKRLWIFQPQINHYRLAVWDGLVKLGYDLSVLGPLDEARELASSRAYFREQPYALWTVGGQQFAAWPGSERAVRDGRPDVVIVEGNPRNLSSWRLPRRCQALGIPPLCWTKVHKTTTLPVPFLDVVRARFHSRFRVAIVYGQSGREELMRLGVPAEQIHVAQNTIDTSAPLQAREQLVARGNALREQHGLGESELLVSVATMLPKKRMHDLLHVWPALSAARPQLRLVLVGGGPLLEDIRAQAQELDASRITVAGRVPDGDDYAWLAVAHVAVFPGAVGLAVNISLALGTPTVVADEGGPDSELVRHGATGWRFPPGDLSALREWVEYVLNHPSAAARVASQARETVAREATIEQMVSSIDGAVQHAQRRRLEEAER